MNFSYRHATYNDLNEIQEIVTACDVDEFETEEFAIDVKETWASIPFTNTFVIVENVTRIVGYGFVEEMGEGRLDSYGFVHPKYKGLGIGGLLIELLEECGKSVVIEYKMKKIDYEFNNIIPFSSNLAKDLLHSKGYFFKRVYSQMTINFVELPDSVIVPDSISLKACTSLLQEKEIYNVYCEAFSDSDSFYPKPFEQWIHDKKVNSNDQGFWRMAYINDELAGFIIGERQENKIWVNLLGTRRSARRKGIGSILLKNLFRDAFLKGYRTVSLTVDDYSSTNPNQLYRNAGMSTVFQIGMYEKKI